MPEHDKRNIWLELQKRFTGGPEAFDITELNVEDGLFGAAIPGRKPIRFCKSDVQFCGNLDAFLDDLAKRMKESDYA
jgi:hypothetical protein